MQSPVSLENLVEDQEFKDPQDKGYEGTRFSAALQFAGECIKQNREKLYCNVPLDFHLKY